MGANVVENLLAEFQVWYSSAKRLAYDATTGVFDSSLNLPGLKIEAEPSCPLGRLEIGRHQPA